MKYISLLILCLGFISTTATADYACCMHDSNCIVVSDEAECDDIGGCGGFAGEPCDPNPCPMSYYDVCCLPDDSCIEVCQDDCYTQGGIILTAIWDCSPGLCEQLQACCFESYCELFIIEFCESMGGVVHPENSCDPNPCDQLLGACCDISGNCTILYEPVCYETGGCEWIAEEPCDPNPCPACVYPVCCIGEECVYTCPVQCELSDGIVMEDIFDCEPDPCSSSPTKQGDWGEIKLMYQ